MEIKDFIVEIHPLSAADVVEVKTLEEKCNLSSWSINDYYAETGREDSRSFVAKIKNKVIGFIVARLIRLSIQSPLYEIEIFNICIEKRYRRKRIGQSLIYELTKAAKNECTSIWLEVRESNQKAISFYKSLGFETAGKRKNFYYNPVENGVIMRKDFQTAKVPHYYKT